MQRELEQKRKALEKKLRDTRMSAPQGLSAEAQAKLQEKLLQEAAEDGKRQQQNLENAKEQQRRELAEQIRKKKERQDRKREALEKTMKASQEAGKADAGPVTTVRGGGSGQISEQQIQDVIKQAQQTSSSTSRQETQQTSSSSHASSKFVSGGGAAMMAGGGGGPINAGALEQWAMAVVAQLQTSELMRRVENIEKMLDTQVRHGLVSYYMDSRDKEKRNNEGVERPVEVRVADLPTEPLIVYCFANTLRENIRTRAGVTLPHVELKVASQLPNPKSNFYAYRHTCYFEPAKSGGSSAGTLWVRESRLTTIGEFCVVMLHALAHVKASVNPETWNDSDPAFLKEFYGLLECCTEEMFFMRLPSQKAARDAGRGSDYRPTGPILSKETLEGLNSRLSNVGKGEREGLVRKYFELEGTK